MAEVGSAFLTIAPSARGFGSKLNSEVSGELDSSGKTAGKTFGTAIKFGAVAVLGGAAVLGGFLKGAFDEARDAQKVGALTNAVIKSTGGVANVTAGQVDRLATSLSLKTGVDDEAIASGQNMLLTFTNVRNEVGKGNDIFNQATVAAQDMAAAFGGDAVSNSKMLGKALNDPTKGVSALTRVGVSFTQQQKDQISTLQESGNVIGAQKIILGELTKQTGGAAEATATAGDKFKVAFGNLQESVGTALLPLFDKLLNAGTSFVTFLANDIGPGIAALNGYLAPVVSQVQSFFQELSAGGGGADSFITPLKSAFEAVAGAVGGLISAFAPFVSAVIPTLVSAGRSIVAALLPALQSVANTISTQLVPAFQRILPIVTPVVQFLIGVFAGAVVGAIKGAAQAISGIVGVIAGVFNLIAALISGDWRAAWAAVKQIVVGALNAVVGIVKVVLNVGVLGVFRKVAGLIRTLWSSLWAGVRNLAASGLSAVRGLISSALNAVRGLFSSAVNAYVALWRTMFTILRSLASSGLNAIKSLFVAGWNALKGVVVNAFNAIKGAVSAGISAMVNLLRGIPGQVTAAVGNLGSVLYNAGAELINGLLAGITSKLGAIKSKMGEVAGAIKGFLPGSPVKEGPLTSWNNGGAGKRLIDSLAYGLEQTNPIDSAMGKLTKRIDIPGMRGPRVDVSTYAATDAANARTGGGVYINQMVTHDPTAAARALRDEQRKANAMARLA